MSRTMQMPPPPPLLLTKRVTSFLRANLSPHIHAAMLTTPAGSLLAHASNLPASALRRQCAVAASLWALQGPSSNSAQPHADSATGTIPSGNTVASKKRSKHTPPVVTVQLDSGAVFVIRRLRCGMLFICMGGTEGSSTGRRTPTPTDHSPLSPTSLAPTPGAAQHPPQDPLATADTTALSPGIIPTSSRPSTPPPRQQHPPPSTHHSPQPPTTPTPSHLHSHSHHHPHDPSESASIRSAHTTGAATTASLASSTGTFSSVSGMRRQVEELARWLDERLGGLYVPEEGIGIGGAVGLGVEVR